MGRPKSKQESIRKITQTVRLNPEEQQIIKRKAKALNMSLASYFRETALTSDNTRLPKLRNEAISQLQKIGVNWNQIAKYLNTVKSTTAFNDQLLQEFEKINDQLQQALSSLIIKK